MDSYGQKLDMFADGREFVRLSKPLRDHADASCDACGSTQPRTLYCLKDLGAVRYFFVGDNCLKELVKRRVIRRRFGKEAASTAFQEEMDNRSREYGIDQSDQRSNNVEISSTPVEDSDPQEITQSAAKSNPHVHGAEIYVIETKDELHAFVSIAVDGNTKRYWGYAMAIRHQFALKRGGENGLELDWVKSENPQALEHSLSRAMEMAYSRLAISGRSPLFIESTDIMQRVETASPSSAELLTPTTFSSA